MNPNPAGFRAGPTFINLSRVQAVYGKRKVDDFVEFYIEFFGHTATFNNDDEEITEEPFLLKPDEYDAFMKALETYWSGA